jgi:signal transduction histidine kinase
MLTSRFTGTIAAQRRAKPYAERQGGFEESLDSFGGWFGTEVGNCRLLLISALRGHARNAFLPRPPPRATSRQPNSNLQADEPARNVESQMLQAFIVANREKIIDRAQRRVGERTAPKSTDTKLEHGVPILLSQIVDALARAASAPTLHLVGTAADTTEITDTAALHGHELLRNGLTVTQVVNGYGDVCQVVTELAGEEGITISTQEFHAFNKCLDQAIAGAVTAYADQRERDLAYEGTERLGVLAHEMRNLLNTMALSLAIIREGKVGLAGSTGAVLARSVSGLSALVDRSLAQVRLETGIANLQPVSVVRFMEEMQVSGALHAEGYDVQFTMHPVDGELMIDADWHLLASAVSNLLQNAFKFTQRQGTVSLSAYGSADRVLIEVCDECGGLPPGKAHDLFRPFTQGSADRSGLGLGLSIALNAVRANAGDIRVRDNPGTGCIFTIDLPRRPDAPAAVAV